MKGSSLMTADPAALRYLMTETIFSICETELEVVANTSPRFPFYGGNKRNYLFLTHDMQCEWMSAAALDAFTKTLAALKLTLEDIAVLNIARLGEAPAKPDLVAFFHPKVVIALGATLPWDESGDIRVFKTHSFDDMLVDAEKKRVFWTTVKTLLV